MGLHWAIGGMLLQEKGTPGGTRGAKCKKKDIFQDFVH